MTSKATTTIERRVCDRAVKRADAESRKIVGLASIVYRSTDPGSEYRLPWGDVERFRAGAFDNAAFRDTVALFNHEPSQLLGRNGSTLQVDITTRGLEYTIEAPNTTIGNDVLELLDRGDIRGSSFAFVPSSDGIEVEHRDDGSNIYWVNRVAEVLDVGPVTYPAYTSTEAEARSRLEKRHQALSWARDYRQRERRLRELRLDGVFRLINNSNIGCTK